jgi:hypothetical protein
LYIKNLSDAELGWIAGIIDGEGSICLVKNTRQVRISVGNTDKKMIDRLLFLCGGSCYARTHHNPKYKPCWTWVLFKQNQVLWLLNCIIPHLVTKKAKAMDGIQSMLDRYTVREPIPSCGQYKGKYSHIIMEIGRGRSFAEVGRIHGISRERVRQIAVQANIHPRAISKHSSA